MKFTAASVPDQQGKIFVVTGGNSGLGFEMSRVLLKRRAHGVLACRDAKKMSEAARRLKAETPTATVSEIVLDLASLSSIRAAAKEISRQFPRVDVLINNAGVMAIPYRETADGFEMQFGTNHLGHFALTGLLLPLLATAPEARIVTQSSLLHRSGHIDLRDIPKPRRYNDRQAYAMSKLANLLFAYELDRRLKASAPSLSHIISVACHPGYSATNLQHVGPQMYGSKILALMYSLSNALIAQSAAQGALGGLRAATAPDTKGGDYIGATEWFGMRGAPEKAQSSEESHDLLRAKKLWEISEKLTGVAFPIGAAVVAVS
jgi:NAD(P)-dependent dehydrogenase (short-subunit alcohol dehydrogenase family)